MATYGATENTTTEQSQLLAADSAYLQKTITVKSGEGVLTRGTVLALSGLEYVALDPTAGDSTSIAAVVLIDDIDATSAAVECNVYTLGKMHMADLIWPSGITSVQKNQALMELQSVGISVDSDFVTATASNTVSYDKKVAKFQYDFDVDGGAQGDIAVSGAIIPAGAIIRSGIVHVNAAATSGGSATVAIKAVSSEDILAATAVGSLTLNALLDTVPVNTAATSIRLTSALSALTFTVATADLTAGVITVYLEYV